MKNIHLIPTDKPSRLILDKDDNILHLQIVDVFMEHQDLVENQHINITSDSEIKKGDYYLCKLSMTLKKCIGDEYFNNVDEKKIVLTDNEDLIKDGVQAIDDEFLEWFVKNPSCESVEVFKDFFQVNQNNPVLKGSTALVESYKIIIPQEEPLQKTLEKAVKGNTLDLGLLEIELNHTKTLLASCEKALKDRDKQSERMYSEEEVEIIIQKLMNDVNCGDLCYGDNVIDFKKSPRQWFEQFKKK
jgi:hypothetical protein